MARHESAQHARWLASAASRRGLLARLAVLPLGVALTALLNEESEAGRRKRRKVRHRRRKNRRQHNRRGNRQGHGKKKDGRDSGSGCGEGPPCRSGFECVDGECHLACTEEERRCPITDICCPADSPCCEGRCCLPGNTCGANGECIPH